MAPASPSSDPAMIEYRTGNEIAVDAVITLLHASTLAERRPVDDPAIIAAMLREAQLVVTAWDGDRLVGLARTLTDFLYVGYLSDLAVDAAYQRHGIGRRLVEETRARMGPRSFLVLLAAPAAVDYYPRIGFSRHPSAWTLRHGEPLQP